MTLKQNNLCVLKCGLSYCEDFGWFSKHEFKDTNEENTLYISGYKFWFVFIWLYWIWCLHFSRRSPTSLLVMKLMKLIVISYQSWEKSILGALLRMKTCMTTSWAGSDRTFTLFSAFRRWGRNFEIELWSFLPLFQDALLTGSADGPRMPWLLVSMGESFYIRISGLLCVCVCVCMYLYSVPSTGLSQKFCPGFEDFCKTLLFLIWQLIFFPRVWLSANDIFSLKPLGLIYSDSSVFSVF